MEKSLRSVSGKAESMKSNLEDDFTNLGEDISDIDDNIDKKLHKLKTALDYSIKGCGSLADVRENLRWTEHAINLEQFAELHQLPNGSRAKLLVQYTQGLDERFLSSPCGDTLSAWLGPGLVKQVPQRITIVTERLKPRHKVFLQAQEPSEDLMLDCPTLILFPDKVQICAGDSTSGSPQFSDVADDLISTLL